MKRQYSYVPIITMNGRMEIVQKPTERRELIEFGIFDQKPTTFSQIMHTHKMESID